MYYIEQEGNYLVKYDIYIEIEKIIELKREIIEECSEIEHYSYDSVFVLHYKDDLYIRNFQQSYIGATFNDLRDKYHFEYDKYEEPELVKIIDSLLGNNGTVISKLKKPVQPKTKKHQKENELKQEINDILSIDINELDITKIDELKEEIQKYQEYVKLNANRKSELEYYPKVLECIKLTEINRIDKNILMEAESFLSDSSEAEKTLKK